MPGLRQAESDQRPTHSGSSPALWRAWLSCWSRGGRPWARSKPGVMLLGGRAATWAAAASIARLSQPVGGQADLGCLGGLAAWDDCADGTSVAPLSPSQAVPHVGRGGGRMFYRRGPRATRRESWQAGRSARCSASWPRQREPATGADTLRLPQTPPPIARELGLVVATFPYFPRPVPVHVALDRCPRALRWQLIRFFRCWADRGLGKPAFQARRHIVTGQPKINAAEVGEDR